MRVVAIDPRHTSQKCAKCEYQSRSNRKTQALFLCKGWGYQLNADLNASYNIRDKHLASVGIVFAGGLSAISGENSGTSHFHEGAVIDNPVAKPFRQSAILIYLRCVIFFLQ